MDPQLEQRLRLLRTIGKKTAPDKAWVQATRETLLMQVKNALPVANNLSWGERAHSAVQHMVPKQAVHWVSRPIMVMLSLILIVAGGSIMSVSASEQSLPGDFLYGLKLATEQAQIALTPATEDKLKLKTEFTGRRVQELKQVVVTKNNSAQVVQVAEILKSDLNTIKQQLTDVANQMPADQTAAAAKMVDQKTNEVISALQETKDQLPPASKEKITEAQSVAADTGVSAIEVLAQTHQQDSGAVSASDVTQAIKDHAKAVSDVITSSDASSSSATMSTGLTTSTAATLSEIATTTTSSTASDQLPGLVSQIKDATIQIFTLQKAKDQLEITAAASGTADGIATSSTLPAVTASGTPAESTTSTSGTQSKSATSTAADPSTAASSVKSDKQ